MQAYCVKCRKKVEIKNAKSITMKNNRPATQGECPSCGTKVFRIGKAWAKRALRGGTVFHGSPLLFDHYYLKATRSTSIVVEG